MVYLDPAQHRALKAKARSEGVSLAELIRRLAARLLDESPRRPVPPDAYTRLIGLGASGHDDIGDEHDRHVARILRKRHAR